MRRIAFQALSARAATEDPYEYGMLPFLGPLLGGRGR